MAFGVTDVVAAANAQTSSAQNLVSSAEGALDAAVLAASSITFLAGPAPIQKPAPLQSTGLPQVPVLSPIPIPPTGNLPVKPPLQPINPQIPSEPGPLTATAPASSQPSMPAQLRSLAATMPSIGNISAPTAPSAFAGNMPNISQFSMPPTPSTTVQAFAGQLPAEPQTRAPSAADFNSAFSRVSGMAGNVMAFLDQLSPEHGLMYTDLVTKLDEFASGRTETGFSPAVENAIYERSKSKTNAETARVQQDALLTAARRGFTLPGGALMSALQQARQGGADNNATAAREIVVMQAEMQQKNMQFALTAINEVIKNGMTAALEWQRNSIQLVSAAVQYASQLMDALVKIEQLAVQVYNAKLEAYKADASVFETLVQASMREVEVYKAKIQAEAAKIDADKAAVEGFKAQVDAHKSTIDAYNSNMQAVVALANLEKIKVEVYQAQVQAFSAEAHAKAVEFQGYAAAWSGEESKNRAYAAQVSAYTAQVEAYRAKIAAEGERIRALGMSNQSELGAYEADIRAYGAKASANAQVVTAQLGQQNSLIGAYDSHSRAIIAQASAEAERYKAESTVAIQTAQMQNQLIVEQGRISVENIKVAATTAAAVGKAYGDMAASALSGTTNLLAAVAQGG